MLLGERNDGVDALAAILHVDGVDDRTAGDVLQRRFDHRRLGGVHHDRRLDAHREQLHYLGHLLRFVTALGERDAHVEHVRTRFLLLAGDVEDPLVVVGEEQALHLARALRVDALADEQRRRLLAERRGAHRRRHQRLAPVLAMRRRLRLSHRGDDRREMLRRGAAAPADDADAELLDELAQHRGHRERLERIHRLARSRVERQAGVRDHRDRTRGVLGQESHRLAHVLGTRRAIQADHVHLHGLQRRERARDVGAEQHAAARVKRHLRLHGDASHELGEQPLESGQRRLHLEDVLRRLHEQHIDAAFDQVLRLPVVRLGERVEGDVRERRIAARRQHSGRSDRAGDEARAVGRRELVTRRARQPRRVDVDVAGLLLEPPLAQAVRRALKGARRSRRRGTTRGSTG